MNKILKALGKTIFFVLMFFVMIIAVLSIIKQIENYNTPKKEIVVKGTVTIKLNESLEAYKERMGKILNVDKHPAGVSWYEINFDSQNKESRNNTHIAVEVGDSRLKFDYPLGSMVSVSFLPKVEHFSFSLGIGPTSTTSHEKAKEKMYEILKQITDDGWKRHIGGSTARLCGEEALKAKKDDTILFVPALDENYLMNFEEWFSISTYHWNFFYKNEGFMRVTLHREGADKDYTKKSGYFLSIDIKSVEAYATDGMPFEKRSNWKEIEKSYILKNKKLREKRETDAIAKGYHICTNHEDAPLEKGIFPPSSYEPSPITTPEQEELIIYSGSLCPKSGLWQAFLPQGHPKEKLISQSNSHTIHCAKGTHILKFGLLPEDEIQVRWKWIAEKQEQYDPNK